jgi:hypothetical protein
MAVHAVEPSKVMAGQVTIYLTEGDFRHHRPFCYLFRHLRVGEVCAAR